MFASFLCMLIWSHISSLLIILSNYDTAFSHAHEINNAEYRLVFFALSAKLYLTEILIVFISSTSDVL